MCSRGKNFPQLIFQRLAFGLAVFVCRNLHRRDLTPSQRAAAVVACCEWAKSGENRFTRDRVELGSTLQPTNHEMAEAADVSVKTIQQAKAAHAAGLGDQVRDGKLTAERITKP